MSQAHSTRLPTVHIVDDDRAIRDLLRRIIERQDRIAKTYPSAEEFLDTGTGQDRAPQCLILDINLPGMSGLGLQRKLQEDSREIPIVFLAGNAETPTVVRAMKLGAIDYLEKPVRKEHLLNCVDSALDVDAQRIYKESRQVDFDKKLKRLSSRELDVFQLLIDGMNTKQMAAMLNVGLQTVAKHRSAIFAKFSVNNAVELVKTWNDRN